MLSETEKCFIDILRFYFTGEKPEVPSAVEDSVLADYAKKHEVAVLVCSIAKKNGMTGLAKQLNQYHAAALYHAVNNQREYEKVRSGLTAAGISFIPVKGIVLQPYYKKAIDRSMGDVDLLIDTDDAGKIAAVFRELGYHQRKDSEEELAFHKKEWEYELHDRLIHTTYTANEKLQEAFFNDFRNHTVRTPEGLMLDWNFHLLFLFSHLSKHLRSEGAGFRQFMDIAVLVHYHSELFDWKKVEETAREIHLYDFMTAVLSFCRRWFGITLPLDIPEVGEEFYEYATEMIMANGVFGYDNEENGLASLERNTRKYPVWVSKILTVKKLVFPPYKDLVTSSKYAELKGRPWLLPIVWVKRGWRAWRSNRKRVRSVGRTITADNASVKKRTQYLNQWGL